jgi:hypothetical protein
MDAPHRDTEIITYRIPRIEVYQVTDDELCRIEEGCGRVSQDFAFATTFLSFAVAFFIALLTATYSDKLRTIFIAITVICAVGSLYTGIRWWMNKTRVPDVIAKIRSRRTEPQVPPTEQP